MGRKTKLSEWRQRRILNAIRKGHTNAHAAKLAGIDESTFYLWINKGLATEDNPDPDPLFFKFVKAVEQAHVKFAEVHLKNIRESAIKERVITKEHVRKDGDREIKEISRETRPGDPRWSAWLLERKFPDSYGRKIEHSGTIDGGAPPPAEITVVFSDEKLGEAEEEKINEQQEL